MVVSNSHVVFSGCTTLRINKRDGGVDTATIPAEAWEKHDDGDDVAIAPMGELPLEWSIAALQWEDMFPTPERLAELNVGLGDDVFMLGRFVGHTGQQQNQPLARFGSLAMMDGERVKDGRGFLVDAYLADMRSLPGFSGSPVFIAIGAGSYRGVSGSEKEATMMPFYSETIGLLGIDTGHKMIEHRVLDCERRKVEPAQYVKQNSGIAIVAPYYKINDVLQGPKLMKKRAKAEAMELADPERGVSDIAPDDDEFERFEDFTRKLVNIPKKEIDKKRKEEG